MENRMSQVQVAILAAGLGTRLGSPYPKPLTTLATGRSILQQQIDNLQAVFGEDVRVMVVVGFKLDLIMEHVPDAVFVYNQDFDRTNTSKSLLKALRASHDGSVIWMNGDVVFDRAILERLTPFIVAGRSAVAVNTSPVGDEEVAYTVDGQGYVRGLSKDLAGGLGEAVGINLIGGRDKAALIHQLESCQDQDYFERGLELAIAEDGVRVTPVDISDLFAVEVDFQDDLDRANSQGAGGR
jgi:choline kinase